MNEQELIEMRKSFHKRTALWHKAFEIYNDNHDIKLNMRCGSCWGKVYQYFKLKGSTQNKEDDKNN
jgi:hypothetical protein